MKQLGITVDFAPVVDVTDAPDDTVIGDRSFGSNAETVTTYAGRTREDCATPDCFRCSNTSPDMGTARAIRTPAA